ncbi:phosphoglycerate dehydrogenase-like enzyme [Sinorhizobium fredii]
MQLSAEDRNAGVEHVSLDDLLVRSDVVTLHPRVTAETRNMMNAETFAKMKPGAIFVNTARGPLCDYEALHDNLVSGHLSSAMLETFAVEPVPEDWPLLKLPNVTLTPHIAGLPPVNPC